MSFRILKGEEIAVPAGKSLQAGFNLASFIAARLMLQCVGHGSSRSPGQEIILKLRTRITFVTVSVLLVSFSVTVFIAVTAIYRKGQSDIAKYTEEERQQARQQLKDLVDVAYATLDTNYRNAMDKSFLEKYYGDRLRNVIDITESILKEISEQVDKGGLSLAEGQKRGVEAVSRLRYDNGVGYVWINDMSVPYSRMIMHPTLPELDGKILDDPKFNCALGTGTNLFSAFVNKCSVDGEGYVDYLWPKPTSEGLSPNVPKLSYVRLFKPWGWVLGSGIYVDDAVVDLLNRVKVEIGQMRYANGVGYFFINDLNGNNIMHPLKPELAGRRMIDDEDRNGKKFFAEMDRVCREAGGGFVEYIWPKPSKDGKELEMMKLTYVRLYKPLGWSIGTGVYIDRIEKAVAERTVATQKQIKGLIRNVLLISLVTLFFAILASEIFAKSLSQPLLKLIGTMKEIQKDSFSYRKVELNGAEEMITLGEIFNDMLASIRKAVDELTEATAAKEKIESELSIAREIQMDILPRIIPPFPDRPEFDMFAMMDPARQVGGDLYNFFFIDENHFFFAIGDVSGKGVPASLFMSITMTLLRTSAKPECKCDEIVSILNQALSDDAKNRMFLTLFCGVLDVRTGEVSYANGAHDAPILLKANGEASFLDDETDTFIGVLKESTYLSRHMALEPGDRLFLYTDGVTEAMNKENRMFSEKQLMRKAKEYRASNPREMCSQLRADITAFCDGEPQSDDITMMVIDFKGTACH